MSDMHKINSEKRILHISCHPSWRGGEQQLSYLIEELNHFNCLQWVLCAEGNAMASYCKAKQIPSYQFKNPFLGIFGNQRFLKEICVKNAIDLIHVHDSKSHTLAFVSALFGNNRPVIVNRRVDFPIRNNPFSRWKYNNKYIYKYLCVSNKIMEILAKDIKDHSKLELVHSGIDMTRFENKRKSGKLRKEFNIHKDELIIGNIAALADHKDYYTFIDTAYIIKSQGIKAKYLLIGEGVLKLELTKYGKSKGMQSDLIFTGFRNDMEDILPEFDFFLLTSKTEGLGTSILDAMACQVAVVCTNAGGIPEIVQHEVNGLLSDVGDAESLASSVSRLISYPALKQKLIHKAYETAREFSAEKTAQKVSKIYNEIISG